MFKEVTQAAGGRQTINPRTVLGFYATVLGILFTGVIGAIAVLASSKVGTWLIPWLLVFLAVLVVALIGGVFILNARDPSKLMLGQITGTEYAVINRASLGDSLTGERVEMLLTQQPSLLAPNDSDVDASEAESSKDDGQ